jgi:hypothetical protein
MLGNDYLKTEFELETKIGWHISPAGHSSTNAKLFAQMGFDVLFASRVS